MHEQPVPIGELIDTLLCRVFDPQTMAIVATLRNETLQQLQNADANEAEKIRDNFEAKLLTVINARQRHNCTDC